jgi:hypothetical protein
LRKQYEAANRADDKAAMRMARTKPVSPAGAAALLAYLQRDIEKSLGSLADWHMIALKTAAGALARMTSPSATRNRAA